jgi:hypothetical protein
MGDVSDIPMILAADHMICKKCSFSPCRCYEPRYKKVLVCGGRTYKDWDLAMTILDLLMPDAIVHGGAKGADTLAGEWAALRKKEVHAHPARWDLYRGAAGPIRNKEMLDKHPDLSVVVAFPGGDGTDNMIEQAVQRGIPVLTVIGR